MPKRIPLFLAVNILLAFAVAVTADAVSLAGGGVAVSVGLGPLLVISLVWGAIGAFVTLPLASWLVRRNLATIKAELKRAREQANTLARLQVAKGLAPMFLERSRPYEQNAELSAMLDERLLHKAAFVQKPPALLRFYKRLLMALDRTPEAILEIGVKGGGSTALWKAIFPDARVVGMDLKFRRWLPASNDGVVYVEGDQADRTRLEQIAAEHGPFDLVIDDGSHVSGDQAITMRALLPHVRPGGFYIVEDTHASLKAVDDRHKVDYGADIWPDFVVALLDRRQQQPPASAPSEGAQLAVEIDRHVDDLIVGTRVLALRAAARK